MSNQPTGNHPAPTHSDVDADNPARVPGPIDVAGTLDSPAQEALNAFHARWQLIAGSEKFELREPEAGRDVASIGIARRGASSIQVVRVSVQEHTTWIRLSVSKSKRSVDMAAASRVLYLPIRETGQVLLAASEALRHMRTVARLATERYSARSNADALERTLDLEARTAGLDANFLKDPQAQRGHVGVWEGTRDRFNAAHGPTIVVATGNRARSYLTLRIGDLIDEQDALWMTPIKKWLWAGSTQPRPSGSIFRALALLPRAASNVASRIARIRQVGQALHVVEECQRITDALEDAHERLANAEALCSARLEERRLTDAIVVAVKEASTPVERPGRPASHTGRPAPRTSRTLLPPVTPAPPRAPRPDTGPPSL
ncbi:hypothetical protein ACFS27_22655 [Promicromonospora vindobonensis]|uniref:Uncharacterized protein n=1 Tax=Promicromonospora vindobonensis TaxID=195748 RepID=A0ABW5VZP1_9MICO